MPENYNIKDSGTVTKAVNLTNVKGIRAICSGSVSSGGGPSWDNSSVRIYEIQANPTDVSGQEEKRYELDIIIDTKHSALDNIERMIITCNAALINSLILEE